MASLDHDRRADGLLDLDGQVFVVEAKGEYWVRFVVRRVDPSPERPHGLTYSLTLHGPRGTRPIGFDNAHAARGHAALAEHPRAPTTTGTGWTRSVPIGSRTLQP